jgi:hypothetical protein
MSVSVPFDGRAFGSLPPEFSSAVESPPRHGLGRSCGCGGFGRPPHPGGTFGGRFPAERSDGARVRMSVPA